MNPISLSINVTDALAPEVTEGQRVRIGAWLFVPPDLDPSSRPAVVSLLNGGSYDKRYFHVQVPGQPGYSMAEYLAARGHIVVLPDHLGIGDSDRLPDGFKTTRQVAAAANHAAMEALYARLADGTLAKGLPPVPDCARIGGGHSMGGMQTITQQAQHRTYERVMVLGYTAAGVHLFHEGQSFPAARPWEADHPAYWRLDHASIAESFHWDDVPPEVLRVDEELAVDVPYRLSWESTQSGIVTADAARIEVAGVHLPGRARRVTRASRRTVLLRSIERYHADGPAPLRPLPELREFARDDVRAHRPLVGRNRRLSGRCAISGGRSCAPFRSS